MTSPYPMPRGAIDRAATGRLIYPDDWNTSRTEFAPGYTTQPVDWDAFDRFAYLMLSHRWIYARTMPKWPHFYTLRKQWSNDEDFRWAVDYLMEHGYRVQWGGKWYTQFNINEHHYWNMGWDSQETILINRAEHNRRSPYDVVAPGYDAMFSAPQYREEDEHLFQFLDREVLSGHESVPYILDVGAGTGLALQYLTAPMRRTYTAIEPSMQMLLHLRHNHPGVLSINTPLRDFSPPLAVGGESLQRYDAILALYGVGSYMSRAELARIPTLLNPGGRAAVMFFSPGYTPETHQRLTDVPPYEQFSAGIFPGEVYDFGHHTLVLFEKE